MSLESLSDPPPPSKVVLGNIELNDRCSFTKACGQTCYLNLVHVSRPPLQDDLIFEAAQALILRGDVIRHLAIPGKEPFESPALLRRIAKFYHAQPTALRPASLGVISASTVGIRTHISSFVDSPLCWLAVSVDVAESGLRAGNPLLVLEAALEARRMGGAKAVAVNTTFTKNTINAVLALSETLAPHSLDQWTLCPLMERHDLSMRPIAENGVTEALVERLGRYHDIAERVVVETEPATLRRIIGEAGWSKIKTNVWRIEVLLPNGVWLFARTPRPGYFVRMRFDGALLSRLDFAQAGLQEGRYGRFASRNDMDLALSQMQAERTMFDRSSVAQIEPRALADTLLAA